MSAELSIYTPGVKATHAALAQALELELPKFLPDEAARRRFAAVIMQVARGNQTLQDCSLNSVLYCAIELAQLDLDPNTFAKEVYLIPKGGQCVAFFGQGAFLKPLRESGWATGLTVGSVYEGEPFSVADVSDESASKERNLAVSHVPTLQAGKLLGVWVRFAHPDNTQTTSWFPVARLEAIRAATGGTGKGWQTFPWAMYEKIAIKQACKRQALMLADTRLARIVELDNQAEAASPSDTQLVKQLPAQNDASTYSPFEADTPTPELPPFTGTPLTPDTIDHLRARVKAGIAQLQLDAGQRKRLAELPQCKTLEDAADLYESITGQPLPTLPPTI